MLLSVRNLLSIIREPQPYVLPIIPRPLSKVVVPREHHVLKDLPFYEEAREADAKAHQDRLEQKEKKRQEGKLRQTSSGNRMTTTFTARHPTKKKSSAKAAKKAPVLIPESTSTSTFFVPTSAASTVPDSEADLDLPRVDPNIEPELVVPRIIHGPKREENMAANLKVGFREK